MTAAERVIQTLNARRVRDGEYRARCPVHQGRSTTSLSIKDVGDRVLLHCHSGCKLGDILAAIGMQSARELSNDITRIDRETTRQMRIRKGERVIESWAATRLVAVATELRNIDKRIGSWVQILRPFGEAQTPAEQQIQENAWAALSVEYKARTDLEIEFEALNGKELGPKIALYREVNGV